MVSFSFFLFFFFFSFSLFFHPSHSSQSLISNPNFDPQTDLFGDAHFLSDSVKLTRRSNSTSGLLLRRHPIPFTSPTSISVEFSFSISSDPGDGLLLVLVPADLAKAFPGNGSFGLNHSNYLGVEFDTSKDDNVGDLNGNHVGVDVGSLVSVAVANVSKIDLVLNSGERLKALVDYEAGSNRLEVRLGKLNESGDLNLKLNQIISYEIDLFKMWGGQSVFVGLSSSNKADSVQVVSVYSWKVMVRNVSKSLHYEPVDPRGLDQSRKLRPLRFLAAVIFGTVCVTLVTFVVLFMWVIFFQRSEEESLVKIPDRPATDVRYERIDVAVDKNTEDDEH